MIICHTPSDDFKDCLRLDNGERANSERRVYGRVSTRFSQSHPSFTQRSTCSQLTHLTITENMCSRVFPPGLFGRNPSGKFVAVKGGVIITLRGRLRTARSSCQCLSFSLCSRSEWCGSATAFDETKGGAPDRLSSFRFDLRVVVVVLTCW